MKTKLTLLFITICFAASLGVLSKSKNSQAEERSVAQDIEIDPSVFYKPLRVEMQCR